jgi:hypothetical protein
MTNDQIINIASAAGATAPIADVSSRYTFVPTIEAVDLLRSLGWFPVSAEQSGTRGKEGFQKHMIRFAQGSNLELTTGEERVDLVLYNSHNTSSAFKLAASVWRKICGNGLMVASEFAEFSHRHVGFNEIDFMQSANKIADSASMIQSRVETFKAIQLSPAERAIFANAAHELVYDEPAKAPIRPDQLLHERRYDDEGKDLFTSYNVIQENIIKGGVKGWGQDQFGRAKRTTTRAVKSIDRNLKLNKVLWSLTEKMAELKNS